MSYFDLGSYHRPVTAATAEAQTWFDRGLVWMYGFNHEEAIVCFEKAVAACPNVMECYFMTGDVDYLLRVIADDPQDYERLYRRHLSRLPGVARIKSSFALRAVSRRTAIDV